MKTRQCCESVYPAGNKEGTQAWEDQAVDGKAQDRVKCSLTESSTSHVQRPGEWHITPRLSHRIPSLDQHQDFRLSLFPIGQSSIVPAFMTACIFFLIYFHTLLCLAHLFLSLTVSDWKDDQTYSNWEKLDSMYIKKIYILLHNHYFFLLTEKLKVILKCRDKPTVQDFPLQQNS